jgi:hypothetical protein
MFSQERKFLRISILIDLEQSNPGISFPSDSFNSPSNVIQKTHPGCPSYMQEPWVGLGGIQQ